MLDIQKIRSEYPILSREVCGKPLIYLDSAATSQTPRCVVERIDDMYYTMKANVHRGVHQLSQEATERQERTRERVRQFFNAASTEETDLPPDSTEFKPGQQAHRWQIPMLLDAGVSLLTAPRNSFFRDDADGRRTSIFRLFHPASELTRAHRELTAISAWAWGYSLLFDLAQTAPEIDPRQIWAHGHSRLGKTALWALANDPRFAGVVSNDSGCCGASLTRDRHAEAENLPFITRTFPWWFPDVLDSYAGHEDRLPFDQHWLLALAAPRPLLVASATEDVWADPFNEFRAARAVECVYRLFGARGLGSASFPKPEEPLFGDRVGYYLRTGKHDVTATDWKFVLEFLRRNAPDSAAG